MKHNRLYAFCCALAFAAGMVGCVADPTLDPLPDGSSTLSATVEFRPLVPTLDASTRTAGDKIKAIESLCVLLYDAQGNLVERYPLTETSDANPAPGYYKLSDEERNPGDGYPAADETDADQPIAEARTPRAAFTLPGTVPYGDYYLYAVANMGDLSDRTEAIATVEGLRSIRLTWQTDVSRDNQMFGFFTPADEVLKQAPLLRIATPATRLHAWLRRAASKVTIAYDGSELEEGVFVYLKSVRIVDIPKTCALGDTNTPTDKSQLTEGEQIVYVSGEDYNDSWPARITKGRPIYPRPDDEYDADKEKEYLARAHSETADALFFYENMQGEGKDKRQDADKDGSLDVPGNKYEGDEGYKDDVPYGTYIEVKAFYRSINLDRLSSGEITYRFMLGKNETTDYNAERNHHYKLTLRFKRFANDVDWHIDYTEEDPGMLIPSPFYISYLYNHTMQMPLKINTAGREIVSLRAEIVENGWAPTGAPKNEYYSPADLPVEKPFNGFLSLRRTEHTVIPSPGGTTDKVALETANKAYYYDNYRHLRNYLTSEGSHNIDAVDPDQNVALGEEGDGRYRVTIDRETKSSTFQIPLYTRAKQLIIKTGFTGNNPYEAYPRTAKVKFVAKLRDAEGAEIKLEDVATIIQVPRIVNPKGVWRKHDSTTPFHVVLKRLPQENADRFETFTSEGSWKAYVVRGDRSTIHLAQDTVRGRTDTPIDFNIYFEGCQADESKCAVIRVEYHNCSCYHLIFARQGSASIALVPGGTRWRTSNMRTATTEAACPTEEGSLFRFANWDDPIDATNNVYDGFKDNSETELLIAGTTTKKKWSDIPSGNNMAAFSDPTVDGRKLRVATFRDFEELYQADDIEQGYGVLYGDDATETLSAVDEVYGHSYTTHGGSDGSGKGYGMRGTFVYNKSEKDPVYGGRNLFFPIGASGYGQRKNKDGYANGTAVVKYAGIANVISDIYRPLFYDLYRRPGAIYWLKELVDVTGRAEDDYQRALGWDFNYFSFDFNLISAGNIINNGAWAPVGQPSNPGDPNTSNACFVRCVEID